MGIEISGAVNTSSPGVLIIFSPLSSKISTGAPKSLHCNSPGFDSDPGRPPRKAEHTSVPPLSEMI